MSSWVPSSSAWIPILAAPGISPNNPNTWTALQSFQYTIGTTPALFVSPNTSQSSNVPVAASTNNGYGIYLLGQPATSSSPNQDSPAIAMLGQQWTSSNSVPVGFIFAHNATNNSLLVSYLKAGTTLINLFQLQYMAFPTYSTLTLLPSSGVLVNLGGTQALNNVTTSQCTVSGQLYFNGFTNTNQDTWSKGRYILSRSGDANGYNSFISPSSGSAAIPIAFYTQSSTAAGIGNSVLRFLINAGGTQGASPLLSYEALLFMANGTAGVGFVSYPGIAADGTPGNLILNAPGGKLISLQISEIASLNVGSLTAKLLVGLQYNVQSITASTTLNGTSSIVLVNASAGAVTVTLPASSNTGMYITIVKTDASANAVTVAPAGTDTIEGSTSKVISAQYGKVSLVSGGAGVWYDIGTGAV